MVIRFPAHAFMSYCRRISFALTAFLCLVFVSEVAHGVIADFNSETSMPMIMACDSEIQDSTDKEEEPDKKENHLFIGHAETRQAISEQAICAHYVQFLRLHEAFLILRTPPPRNFI